MMQLNVLTLRLPPLEGNGTLLDAPRLKLADTIVPVSWTFTSSLSSIFSSSEDENTTSSCVHIVGVGVGVGVENNFKSRYNLNT